MIDSKKFWMVWNPRTRHTNHQHLTRAAALAEAKRLAECHPEDSFFVLEAITHVRPAKPPLEVADLAEATIAEREASEAEIASRPF